MVSLSTCSFLAASSRFSWSSRSLLSFSSALSISSCLSRFSFCLRSSICLLSRIFRFVKIYLKLLCKFVCVNVWKREIYFFFPVLSCTLLSFTVLYYPYLTYPYLWNTIVSKKVWNALKMLNLLFFIILSSVGVNGWWAYGDAMIGVILKPVARLCICGYWYPNLNKHCGQAQTLL